MAQYDTIVYGGTGYTGRLVAEYLNKTYGLNGDVTWAVAGRSAEKFEAVKADMDLPADTPFVEADANDRASLDNLVKQTKVIISTVGPYQLYGSDLVAACAEAGTDYVDLSGEPGWMHKMIEAHDAKARETGARIVHSCGFDSIPFDLGVYTLQKEALKRHGAPCPRVRGRVRQMQGKFSGGTAYSMKATMDALKEDPGLLAVLANPFSLSNGFEGPEQPAGNKPMEDEAVGQWAAPFVMAPINTKNIHRSNALMGQAYGESFTYDEMMLTGPGDEGKAMAEAIAGMDMIGGEDAPKPGEGPTKEERENGHYDVLFHGTMAGGETLTVGVTGDKDPGYGSTSKMLAESALCLAKDNLATPGGVWTPAPAMGDALVKRLEANAGMTFKVES